MIKVRVGFIGCGRIADLHVPGYRAHEGGELVAICDRDPGLLERRKAEWGVEKVFADYREMLADPGIDAVEILTPQPLHESMTIEAARAGKHIALQKPASIDLASTDRMLAAVQEAGVVFKITENYVFYPPIVRARQLLEAGEIGDLISVRIQMISGAEGGWEVPAEAWEWRVKEAREGRGFQTFDHGHHLWSTAWLLGGEVERVTGWIDSSDGLIDSPAHFLWKYRDGVRYGQAGFAHGDALKVPSKYYSNDEWIELFGSKGIILIRRCTGNVQDGPPLSLYRDGRFTHFEDVESDWLGGFVGATGNFIAAVQGREEPLLSGAQGREVLRFSLALQRAARLRREVYLDELDRDLPGLYAWRRRRRERRQADDRPGLLERLGLGADLSKYADQALPLTEQLLDRFDPGDEGVPNTCIGLILRGDGLPEQRLALVIRDNEASLLKDEIPADAALEVTMSPGLWAAVLLKKKRIEMAVIQGKIRFTGKAEEALKLKKAFDF